MARRPTTVLLCLCAIFQPSWASECPLSLNELHDGAPFLTNRLSSASNSELVNCTWYRKDTCCSAEDTLRISHADPEISLRGSTRACRDALHLLMCAPCSPLQKSIFVQRTVAGFPVSVLRTCESFCDRLYSACSSSGVELAGGRVDRVDAAFASGRAFCRAAGLRVVGHRAEEVEEEKEDEGRICFSAAARRVGGSGGGRGAPLTAASLLAALSSLSVALAHGGARRRRDSGSGECGGAAERGGASRSPSTVNAL